MQKFFDNLWYAVFLRFLPNFVKPDHFTWLRLLLLPLIIYFFVIKNFLLSLILFILAILCDSWDGSLARKRRLNTDFGKMADPLIDKLLIISVLVLLLLEIGHQLILISILIDLFIVLGAFLAYLFKSKLTIVDWLGKIKMIFQSITIIILWLSLINPKISAVILFFLYPLIVLQLLTFFNYFYQVIKIKK